MRDRGTRGVRIDRIVSRSDAEAFPLIHGGHEREADTRSVAVDLRRG
jgi:hypothetical protein